MVCSGAHEIFSSGASAMYSESCGGMICCGKKASKDVRTYNAGICGNGFREGVDLHQKVRRHAVAAHAILRVLDHLVQAVAESRHKAERRGQALAQSSMWRRWNL